MTQTHTGVGHHAAPGPLGSTARPTPASARIESIDALRGFAVLGILLINILVMAIPTSGSGPRLLNDSGFSFSLWLGSELTVAGAMRAIFSMLFGAGVVLFSTRRGERFEAGEVADAYYRRTIWLVAFGLVHAFILLAWWDILFVYGIAGMFLYSFRRLRPRWLILTGVLVLSVPLPVTLRDTVRLHAAKTAAEKAADLRRSNQQPDGELQRQAKEWAELVVRGIRPADAIRSEIEARRSGYWANFRLTAWTNLEMQSTYLYERAFWDASGMMFLGMALLKLGVLTGARSRRFYAAMAVFGFAMGLTINYWGLLVRIENDYDPWSVRLVYLTHDPGRLAVALGYIGIAMLVFRSAVFQRLTRTLSAVGRMALTNYLVQSMFGVLLFYGFGLGWFARLELGELLWPVAAIWSLQLIYSPLWLSRYRFGPAEWLWRCLTYGRLEPIRRTNAPA